MASTPSIESYLDPHRLADVLALIQVLAYDPSTRRTEEGLRIELRRIPLSCETWIGLGQQHPEFFRVRTDIEKSHVALIARVVRAPETVREDGTEMRPALTPDVVNKLMELAIGIHDRQLERRQRWKTVVLPMAVAILAAGASIAAAVITASKPTSNPVAQPAPK